MPTYEYQCADCGTRFEVRATMKDREQGLKPACPTCGNTRVVPALSVVAIGSGSRSSSQAKQSGCCGGTGCCS